MFHTTRRVYRVVARYPGYIYDFPAVGEETFTEDFGAALIDKGFHVEKEGGPLIRDEISVTIVPGTRVYDERQPYPVFEHVDHLLEEIAKDLSADDDTDTGSDLRLAA